MTAPSRQATFALQLVEHARSTAVPLLRGDVEAAVAQLEAAGDDRARDAQRVVELLRVVGLRIDALCRLLEPKAVRPP